METGQEEMGEGRRMTNQEASSMIPTAIQVLENVGYFDEAEAVDVAWSALLGAISAEKENKGD